MNVIFVEIIEEILAKSVQNSDVEGQAVCNIISVEGIYRD